MNRTEFLSLSCMACLAAACSKDEMATPSTPQPSNPSSPNNSITINLSTELKAINEFVAKSGVIVIRTASGNTVGSFVAFSSVCPHAGSLVEYNTSTSVFNCAAHGSVFSSNGGLVQGPATKGLTKLNVAISGTTLVVT